MLFKLLCLGVSLPQETGVEPYPSTTEKEGGEMAEYQTQNSL